MTKSLQKIVLVLAATLATASSAFGITPEYNTYLRAGTGSNGAGGKQECISNSGASAFNEFRLGNECGIYGEFMITANLLKAEGEGGPYWKVFSDFAFSYENSQTWENRVNVNASKDSNPATPFVTDVNAEHNNWVLTELYTEAGNIDGMKFSIWAGKRYYRWSDIHMLDFYPVNFSGPGAGIGDMAVGSGILHAAIIQNTGSNVQSVSTPATPANNIATEAGTAAKTSLHVRWEQVKSDWGAWSFWLAGAMTPSTKDAATGTSNYKSTTGSFLAVKNNIGGDKYNNELGVAYGHSNLSNMGTGGELVLDCNNANLTECNVEKSNRVRAWENFTVESDKWSTQLSAVYEQYNRGTEENEMVRWSSLGVRPTYWFTDHLSMAFQAGISNVVDDADGLGSRNLARLTVAPQISMAKGYYSRPVLRAYYSKSFWNENNKVSAKDTTAKNDTSLDSFGIQTEVWF